MNTLLIVLAAGIAAAPHAPPPDIPVDIPPWARPGAEQTEAVPIPAEAAPARDMVRLLEFGIKIAAVVPEERPAIKALKPLGARIWADSADARGHVYMVALEGSEIDDAQAALLASFHELRALEIAGPKITPEGLRPLLKLPRLRELRLAGAVVTEEHLALVARVSAIERLELYAPSFERGIGASADPPLTGAAMARLGGLTNLKDLSLGLGCVGRDVVREAAKHKTIQRLWLDRSVTPEAVAELRPLSNLKLLYVHVPSVPALAEIGQLTSLEKLDVGSIWTDESLEKIQRLTNLRSLYVSLYGKNPRVTDAGMVFVGRLAGLEKLALSGARVGDAGVARLVGLAKLEELHLNHTKVTGAGFGARRAFPALRTLGLADTPFDDAGARALAGLPALEVLELSGTKVTDAGIKFLRALPRLRCVGVERTAVTAAGARALPGGVVQGVPSDFPRSRGSPAAVR
jgi:hypothetical protein